MESEQDARLVRDGSIMRLRVDGADFQWLRVVSIRTGMDTVISQVS